MASLKTGQWIPLADGDYAEILSFINEGGQGEVYRVRYQNKICALKWYSKQIQSREFYQNLKNNIAMGSPSQSFLWPEMITKMMNQKFGYLMPLREKNYQEYGEFLTGEARFKSWEILIQSALNIVESFYDLHSAGFSYQDINEGSFFIHPDTGRILICDNDNVAPFGENWGVRGMPKYMAPEVVMGQCRPNTHTDRFSLAVILFRLFYIDHPLEGKYTIKFPLTDSAGAELFGKNAVFIYDPKNDINRPDSFAQSNVIRRWNLFPPDLKSAFLCSFTKGLHDINKRLTEQQWLEVLIKVRSMLVRLDGKERFVNVYAPQTLPEGCMLLQFENHHLMALAPESKLYPCQTERANLDYQNPSGIIKCSRTDPHVYGLGNLSENFWRVKFPDGTIKKYCPRSFLPLVHHMLIDFGTVKARVF